MLTTVMILKSRGFHTVFCSFDYSMVKTYCVLCNGC